MQTDSDLYSPLYTYNGPANLQELERANLTGARIFFNGSSFHHLQDILRRLRDNLAVANGKEAAPDDPNQ